MDTVDSKLLQAAIVLSREYVLIDRLVTTGEATLRAFENVIGDKRESIKRGLDVYNYVYALIEHLARYQKLASSVPRINQKSVEFRSFDRAMGRIKEARNSLQHLNNAIENTFTGPLMGSINWRAGGNEYLVAFHDIGRQRDSPGIIFDTKDSSFRHTFVFVYNHEYHDLEAAIQGVRELQEYIDSRIQVEIDGRPYDPKEHLASLKITLQYAPFGAMSVWPRAEE